MRKSSLQALHISDLMLCQLTEEIRLAEQQALAHNLHDTVVQPLMALMTQMRCLKHHQRIGAEPLEAQLDSWQALAQEAMQSLRATLDTLVTEPQSHPHTHNGLVQALRRYVAPQLSNQGIHLRIERHAWPTHLPPKLSSELYLALREALTNIEQHTTATEAMVRLTGTATYLEVTISDNGMSLQAHTDQQICGKDRPRLEHPEHLSTSSQTTCQQRTGTGLGISSMRNRVRRLGGLFELISMPPEKAMCIHIRIPYSNQVSGVVTTMPTGAATNPKLHLAHHYRRQPTAAYMTAQTAAKHLLHATNE